MSRTPETMSVYWTSLRSGVEGTNSKRVGPSNPVFERIEPGVGGSSRIACWTVSRSTGRVNDK